MKCLGILSDTHNRLDGAVLEFLQGSDHILHAGDICQEHILEKLREVAPVTAVLGNNDSNPSWREVERREFNGVRFAMIHIRPTRLLSDCDWLLFGHTHVPFDQIVNGVRLFNPGSASLANKGAPRSAAKLHWRNDAWTPELRIFAGTARI